MKGGSLELRTLVDGFSAAEFYELRDAVTLRLRRKKRGTDVIKDQLAKLGCTLSCSKRGVVGACLDDSTPDGRSRYRCPACSVRLLPH